MFKNKILFLFIFSFVFFTFADADTIFAAACAIPPNSCETPTHGDCPGGRSVTSDTCSDATKLCCAPSTPAPATPSGGLQYTLLEKIPFFSGSGSDLPGYILAVYNLALVIIVLSAVFMVSIGGFLYLTSAGNTSSAETAKHVITDALLGLVIALIAWLLLNAINPDLVNVSINGLSAVPAPSAGPIPTPTPGACPSPNTTATCCPANSQIPCQACSGCSEISGVTNKGCGLGKCFLETNLLNKIKTITGVTGWRITESWPPTVKHLSSCHQNGTCADLNNSGGDTSQGTIKAYYDAFRAAGLNVLYESKDCSIYIANGVTNCKSYPTMTNGSSFHVY